MTSAVPGPDILSREHKRDPFSFYARLRAAAPVVRLMLPGRGAAWFLTRYRDVVACLTGDRQFVRDFQSAGVDTSGAIGGLLLLPNPTVGPHILNFDGVAHRRLRAPMAKWFTVRAVERWRLEAERIVAMLLDRMAERGDCDFVADLAQPFTIAVMGLVLGLPIQDWRELEEWSAIAHSRYAKPERQAVADTQSAFHIWVHELFRNRKAAPADDFVSALVRGDGGEEPLSERELIAMIDFLLGAGQETSADLIPSAVLELLERSIAVGELVDDGDALRDAIEELLRFCAPVETALPRCVAEDVEFGGERLRRGDFVFPIVAAANRDADRFDEPDRLDLSRRPNPHIAFGAGPHHCIGLHLARMEAEVALRALFRRFPRLSLIRPRQQLVWLPRHIVRGLEALPVRLS